MYKRNIQRLTQTYLTLSLQDIANTVQLNGPKEAEMHVLQMVVLKIIPPHPFHFHVASTFYLPIITYSWTTDSGWWDICINQPEGWNGEILRRSRAIQNLWNDWAYWFINPEVWFYIKFIKYNGFPVLPDMTISKFHLKSWNENMLPKKFLINYFNG